MHTVYDKDAGESDDDVIGRAGCHGDGVRAVCVQLPRERQSSKVCY